MSHFLNEFQILSEVFAKLDSIKDTTEADIKESKRLYKEEIAPTLEKLNLYLNMLNARNFMNAQELESFNKLQSDNIENLSEAKEYESLRRAIYTYAQKFSFFNYEIEFPEIVANKDCHSKSSPCHTEGEARSISFQINRDISAFSKPQYDNNPTFIGFQAIVGNPPWDKTQFRDSDFFPQFISNYRTLTNSGKKEVQENLLAKSYIKKEYEQIKAFIDAQNIYYQIHSDFCSGQGNLFRFFVERNLRLLAPLASLNYVLPSALMLEVGSFNLRKEILENKMLKFFYSFENREGIFRDVDSRYKFALMQVVNAKCCHSQKVSFCHSEGESPKNLAESKAKSKNAKSIKDSKKYTLVSPQYDEQHTIQTMFYKTRIEEVYEEANIIPLTLQDIQTLSPNQLALQEVRSKKDLEILKKCYATFTPLNSKWLDFRNELNMTLDKELFIESFSDGLLPLYEGKMIWQFNAEFSEAQYFLDTKEFDKRLRSKEIYRLKQDLGIDSKEYERLLESMLTCHSEPAFAGEESRNVNSDRCFANAQHDKVEAHYDKTALEDSFIKYDREFYRLGFRAIASDTNERTLIFSLLPKNIGFGHTMYGLIPKKYVLDNEKIIFKPISHLRICFALGIFNALVVDFIARGMIQISVDKTYISRIPIPQPSDKEILENPAYLSIAKNALILQLYNDKAGYFKELQKEFKISQNEIPTTPKAYDTLKARQDIAIAKLYGLDKEEFCHLLESFKVLQSKKPQYIALLKSLWE